MIRLIELYNKDGNREYICNGTGCDVCAIRYKCFTNSLSDIVKVDWSQIKTHKSPMRLLESVTGSKIYVKGSKKYIALAKKMREKIDGS